MRLTNENSYAIEMKMNGEVIKKRAVTLEEAILKCMPLVVLTEAYVTAKKDGQVSERRLNLNQARDLFRNPDYRMIFINNLLLN